jgi:hypothetical protein
MKKELLLTFLASTVSLICTQTYAAVGRTYTLRLAIEGRASRPGMGA